MKTIQSKYGVLAVVLMCFFTMGFVDLVGIASNYVQEELALSNSLSGMLVAITFLWFLVFSVPTGLLMNHIGRKPTVLLAIGVAALALLVPMLTFVLTERTALLVAYFASFCLLGISNALMQTSLNPMVENVVGEEQMTSTMALGQFVKALASFATPMIAMWGVGQAMGWKVVYPIYLVVALVCMVLLGMTHVKELPQASERSVSAELRAAFSLLKSPYVLLCFFGVMCAAGMDIGTNTTAPKLMMERCGMELAEAGFATSLYFIFRTIGCFSGAAILARWSDKRYFLVSVLLIVAGMLLLLLGHNTWLLYTGLALVGMGNANTCIIIFSRALRFDPAHSNEMAGLMVTGLFGAMVFPLVMGFASDWCLGAGLLPTIGAVAVMLLAAVYMLVFTRKL